MIVVTKRRSKTQLFVDIPTNHKLVIVFSIIRKVTAYHKLKQIYATNTNRRVTVFLLTKKCKRSTTCYLYTRIIRVTYLYKSELAVKDFSLSLSFNIFLHVNVMN